VWKKADGCYDYDPETDTLIRAISRGDYRFLPFGIDSCKILWLKYFTQRVRSNQPNINVFHKHFSN